MSVRLNPFDGAVSSRRKVFIIGLGKTGTTSLGKALHLLGYNNKTFDPKLVLAYDRNDHATIDVALATHDSFDDFPWPLIYQNMSVRFPDARFILTVRRDPDTWYESLCQHAWRSPDGTYRKVSYGVEQPQFHRRLMLRRYQQHIQDVQSFFEDAPERLLLMCLENGHGWNELCSFLELPTPKASFVHANKSPMIEVTRREKARRRLGYYKRGIKSIMKTK